MIASTPHCSFMVLLRHIGNFHDLNQSMDVDCNFWQHAFRTKIHFPLCVVRWRCVAVEKVTKLPELLVSHGRQVRASYGVFVIVCLIVVCSK